MTDLRQTDGCCPAGQPFVFDIAAAVGFLLVLMLIMSAVVVVAVVRVVVAVPVAVVVAAAAVVVVHLGFHVQPSTAFYSVVRGA